MKLFEYEAKAMLKNVDVLVPDGHVVFKSDESWTVKQIKKIPVWIKAQVLYGNRQSKGLVKKAEVHDDIFGMIQILFDTHPEIHAVLIEDDISYVQPVYFCLCIHRPTGRVEMLFTPQGGSNIEKHIPEINRYPVNSSGDVCSSAFKKSMTAAKIPKFSHSSFNHFIEQLTGFYFQNDLILLEINPLVFTSYHKWMALDAKMILDDNAGFRHPEWNKLFFKRKTMKDWTVQQKGISYIPMEGQIGCMVNGAGLAMATLDMIRQSGGKPACFLDLGGQATLEQVRDGIQLILSCPDVRVLLIHIFGGIVRCDQMAGMLRRILEELHVNIPIVLRLTGNHAEEGLALLKGTGKSLIIEPDFSNAVHRAVTLSRSVHEH